MHTDAPMSINIYPHTNTNAHTRSIRFKGNEAVKHVLPTPNQVEIKIVGRLWID